MSNLTREQVVEALRKMAVETPFNCELSGVIADWHLTQTAALRARIETCQFCQQEIVEGAGGHTSSCYETSLNAKRTRIAELEQRVARLEKEKEKWAELSGSFTQKQHTLLKAAALAAAALSRVIEPGVLDLEWSSDREVERICQAALAALEREGVKP